ncbi:MAG: TRAP transporter substrate-binding protein [Tissierellia bacterium]|nr:TRAP transporter substrate-binding protein [Tissierellia bacterium]
MRKFITFILIFCISSLVLAACNNGDADNSTYSFELAMDSPEDTVTYLFGKKFAELVEEKSKGKIKITVYSSGQLGGDREICESVQNGDIAFVVQNTAPQVNFVPELAVFDLPNLFPNTEVARKVLDGPFFDTIAEKYEESNIKLLAYADQGFRVMTTNKKIETIEDFKGQKIRTMENPYHLAYWEALGANPTPMAFAEVYLGLQQGTIDAQENPYEVIVANRFYEQQKYIINTNHLIHLISLITNLQLFNDLPEEDQQIILEAAEEAKVWAREQADLRVESRINTIIENGAEIIELDDKLKGEMAVRANIVYTKIRSEIGDELVDSILKAVSDVL